MVGTDSKARSDLQTFDFGAVFWAVVRNSSVVARPNSIDTRTSGLCALLCAMPLIRTEVGFAGSYVGPGRYRQHRVPITARKSVSFVHPNIKAAQKFSVFLQKLNPSSFQ